jgi:hypothetical protein
MFENFEISVKRLYIKPLGVFNFPTNFNLQDAKGKKVKIFLLQAMEAHRVARG